MSLPPWSLPDYSSLHFSDIFMSEMDSSLARSPSFFSVCLCCCLGFAPLSSVTSGTVPISWPCSCHRTQPRNVLNKVLECPLTLSSSKTPQILFLNGSYFHNTPAPTMSIKSSKARTVQTFFLLCQRSPWELECGNSNLHSITYGMTS